MILVLIYIYIFNKKKNRFLLIIRNEYQLVIEYVYDMYTKWVLSYSLDDVERNNRLNQVRAQR